MATREDWRQDKLRLCIMLAREANHNWIETRDKRYKMLRQEAIQDARYWARELGTLDKS